jgi:hypothetical protein
VATAPGGNNVKITGERFKATLQGYCVRCDFIGWGGTLTKAQRGSETPSFTVFGGKHLDRDGVGKALSGRGLDRSFAVELPDNLADLDSLKRMLPGTGLKGQFNLPANMGRHRACRKTCGPIGGWAPIACTGSGFRGSIADSRLELARHRYRVR